MFLLQNSIHTPDTAKRWAFTEPPISPMPTLVIVESPTKAKTISKFLPSSQYRIMASLGHIRDLPRKSSEIPAKYKQEAWSNLGVKYENGTFKPLYIIPADKRKVVKNLKAALAKADHLIIATDEDREGEAIGWHLLQVLKPRVPVTRMVFHEITKAAILKALEDTRELNQNMVDAQEARRVLDRLVGYKVSPVLWKKIGKGTSAGRVQSVATRLLVEREQQRMEFVTGTYWGVEASLQAAGGEFTATLTHLGKHKLATGKDFDAQTGQLCEEAMRAGVILMREEDAQRLLKRLPPAIWRVDRVATKSRKRSPAPPFITSSLQQEGSRKLKWSAKKTMQVAQKLYEKGHITYMRTDSVTLSEEALTATRRVIQDRYGEDHLSEGVRQHKGRVANAQEAHEAIRPSGSEMHRADQLRLDGDEKKLYDLIWRRTVASQMADAQVEDMKARSSATLDDGVQALFFSAGTRVLFKGFLHVYQEDTGEQPKDKKKAQPLPPLSEGEPLTCLNVKPRSHATKAPVRYTEASLIKKLENDGVGRPSTYASILSTIQGRGSAISKGTTLSPSLRAFATNALMRACFGPLVDPKFTAQMEAKLDEIAQGKASAQEFLYAIDQGEIGIQQRVDRAMKEVDAVEISTIHSPKWEGTVVRVGQYGAYAMATVDGSEMKGSLPDNLMPADISAEQLRSVLGKGQPVDEQMGIHPETNQPILLKKGAYGPYIEMESTGSDKPIRKSLPKGDKPADLTLDRAVHLLNLPFLLGADPKSGSPVFFNEGAYGPYVQRDKTIASIKKKCDDITLEEAVRSLDFKEAHPPKKKPQRK